MFWESMNNKYKFLGIEWKKCGNKTQLTNILLPYIGICIPKYHKYPYTTDTNRLEKLRLELENVVNENDGNFPTNFQSNYHRIYNEAKVIFGREAGQIVNNCKKELGIIDILPPKNKTQTSIADKIILLQKAMEIENKSICNFDQAHKMGKNNIYPELEDKKIGQHQSGIRNCKWLTADENINKRRIEQLKEINFVWDSDEHEFLLIYYSLIIYKNKYGDLLVPQNYKMDNKQDYTKEHFNIPTEFLQYANLPIKEYINEIFDTQLLLGGRVGNIRSIKSYINEKVPATLFNLEKYDIFFTNQRKQMLTDIGFIFDMGEYKWNKVVKASIFYKEIYNNLEVPTKCVINNKYFTEEQLNKLNNIEPKNITKEDMTDFKLGSIYNGIKSKEDYIQNKPERTILLKKIGFSFEKRKSGPKKKSDK